MIMYKQLQMCSFFIAEKIRCSRHHHPNVHGCSQSKKRTQRAGCGSRQKYTVRTNSKGGAQTKSDHMYFTHTYGKAKAHDSVK